jgi:hypothetical protein
MLTSRIPDSQPRVTIARSIVDSVDTIAIDVTYHGARYVVAVSVERSDLSAAEVLTLPDAPVAHTAAVALRAAWLAHVHAIRARTRDDMSVYRLLDAASRALRSYSGGWAAGVAMDDEEVSIAV